MIVALAPLLGIGAMLRYPGGIALDPTTTGFAISANFLSDLGMAVLALLACLPLNGAGAQVLRTGATVFFPGSDLAPWSEPRSGQ